MVVPRHGRVRPAVLAGLLGALLASGTAWAGPEPAAGVAAPRPECASVLDATSLGACLAGQCDWRPFASPDGGPGAADWAEQALFALRVVVGLR